METLERIERGVAAVEKTVVTFALAVAFVSVIIQIARRTFSLLWIPDLYELALAGSASMTFICIGLLTYTKGHITIDIADFIPSQKLRFALFSLSTVAVLAFIGVFGKLAIDGFMFALSSGSKTVQLGIPLLVPYGALSLGLALCLFHSIMNWLRARRNPDELAPASDELTATTGEAL